ncbi:response regulator transcription factor [Streptomyces caniferus]|uniref:response regulator transcription factor n=1 Tax=Streptomyces caniferus TaxID=285557 RepID=UPI0034570880
MLRHSAVPPALAAPPAVFLAIPNELQRFGMVGMLRSVESMGHCTAHAALADAVAAVRDPRTSILLTTPDAVDPAGEVALRRATHDGLRILLLLPDTEDATIGQAGILPGASLLISGDLSTKTLTESLAATAAGETYIPAALTHTLLRRAGHGEVRAGGAPRLTPRERETLVLLVDGYSNKQIARRLRISEHGAKRLVANILAKLNCPNRTLAAARALREGLCAEQTADSSAFPHTGPVPVPDTVSGW